MYYEPLLIPLFLQVLLTFFVWVKMYVSRINEIQTKGIDPQALSTRSKSRDILTDSSAEADNLLNLFEMPVLFYTAMLLALVLLMQDPVLVILAWLYVGLRTVHSLIHTTYNIVMQRFWVYIFSCVTLFAIWLRLAWNIF